MDRVIFDIEERLKARDHKLTSGRKHILKVLLENKDRHMSATEIYNMVKKKVGLATVYRTLELFCDHDILHVMDFGDGHKRYELGSDAKGHYHLHLICLKCGTILEAEATLAGDFEARVKCDYNFDMQNNLLKVFGYCRDCGK
ncbi:Fur family transcriptional regulator [Desulfotomaculum sp. 1211_IL3151]|uniref:Fur family transcriptional regulator n=1 Tax=Desulfotomaculum sp. 1211_IL3151 TaxID=3084055 RepID=UPI002FD90244